jgi:hypothetical protein
VRPSGDQAGLYPSGPVVSLVTLVPSAAMAKTEGDPSRSLAKAMRDPSGEKDASPSAPGLSVRRVTPVPSTLAA